MTREDYKDRVELNWPHRQAASIWPIFLPFLGCPAHCVFCGQEAQSGARQPATLRELARLLTEHGRRLRQRPSPPQLAFYGGTFTAMPEDCLSLCLATARHWRKSGLIDGFRCSTRPDCLSTQVIELLLANDCRLVELGVQTFTDAALRKCGRGHNADQALQGCARLRRAGLPFGIHLLPGLPGSAKGDFLRDVRLAISQGPACLRFHPCLVVADTPLAKLWRQGHYRPWPLTRTLDQLAQGWLMATQAGIPVIRMGLAPQQGMRILAGPWHEALGSRVMGRALALFVARQRRRGKLAMYVPRTAQGYFLGWRRELSDFWHRQSLAQLTFWEKDLVRLQYSEGTM